MDEILPGVVDATSTPLHLMPFSAHTGPRRYRKTAPVTAVQMNSRFQVRTINGNLAFGDAGDYLCEGPHQDRWPCARAVFEDTHEPITDPEPESAEPAEAEETGDGAT